MLKTSSTVDSISRCPGLYRLCVAIQVTCEALGTCTQLHRIVTGKEDSRATWNLPTGSRIPGSRRHRTAQERGACQLVPAVCYSIHGRFLESSEVSAQGDVVDCRKSDCHD